MEKSATTNQRSTSQISRFVGEMNKIMKLRLTLRLLGDLRLCLRHPEDGALGSEHSFTTLKIQQLSAHPARREFEVVLPARSPRRKSFGGAAFSSSWRRSCLGIPAARAAVASSSVLKEPSHLRTPFICLYV
jgi:hypothetical protein